MFMKKICDLFIKGAVYLLVLLMPLFFLPWTVEIFEFNKQYLLFGMIVFAGLFWLIKMVIVEKKLTFIKTPLDLWIFIFMVLMIANAVFSIAPINSWIGSYGRFSDSAIGILSLCFMYFILTNNIKVNSQAEESSKAKQSKFSGIISPKIILNLVIFSMSAAILIFYLSIFDFWSKFSWLPDVMKNRAFNSVSGSLEGLSIFLVVCICVFTGIILQNAAFNSIKEKSKVLREGNAKSNISLFLLFSVFILLVLSVFLLVMIDFSASWIILIISMSLLLLFVLTTRILRRGVNTLLIPIILIIISVACLFARSSNIDLLRDLTPVEDLPHEVLLDYKTTGAIFWGAMKENPVIGSGQGTFMENFSKFKPVKFNENNFWNFRFSNAPSYFLELFTTIGVVGVLGYLWIIILLVLISLNFLKKKKVENLIIRDSVNEEGATFIFALVFGWAVLVLSQMLYTQNSMLSFYFWLFTALLMIVWQLADERLSKEVEFSFKKMPEFGLILNVVLLIIVFVVVYFSCLGGRMYFADVQFANAAKKETSEKFVQESEKVIKLNKYRSVYLLPLSQGYLNLAWEEMKKSEESRDLEFVKENVVKAIAAAKEAAVISPNSVESWENLGFIYRNLQGLMGGEISIFITDSFEKALELEPLNPIFYQELCRVELLNIDVDKSSEDGWNKVLRYCQESVNLKENYLDAQVQLALAYEKKGDLQNAKAQLLKVLDKMKGKNFQQGTAMAGVVSEIYLQLGRVYYNLNEVENAVKYFEQAVMVMPNYANAHYLLGLAYEKNDRPDFALTQYEIVEQLMPGNEDVRKKIKSLK